MKRHICNSRVTKHTASCVPLWCYLSACDTSVDTARSAVDCLGTGWVGCRSVRPLRVFLSSGLILVEFLLEDRKAVPNENAAVFRWFYGCNVGDLPIDIGLTVEAVA